MSDKITYHIYEPQSGVQKSDVAISKAQWLGLLNSGCFSKQELNAILMFLREPDYKSTYTKIGKTYKVSENTLNELIDSFSRKVIEQLGNFQIIGPEGTSIEWSVAMEEARAIGKTIQYKLKLDLVLALREYLTDKLIVTYRTRILEEGLDNSYSKELYKWKLLKASQGKTGKDLIEAILSNEVNILSWRAKDSLSKAFALNPNAVVSCFEHLSSEPSDFAASFKVFKQSCEALSTERPVIADERMAALYLACRYPENHTFFKSDLYQLFCEYLGQKTKQAGEKYPHYLDLLKPIIAKEKDEAKLLESLHVEVNGLAWSELLNAQDLLWQTKEAMSTSLILGKRFTWIPIYKEIAKKVCEYKTNISGLLETIYGMEPVYTNYLHEEDKSKLNEICPFTTLGIYNRSGDERRMNILSYLKDALCLTSELPQDFCGIPTLNAQMSMFFWGKRKPGDCPNLWTIFEKALNNEDFSSEFDAALKQMGVRWNITMGLFWAAPDTYLTLDENTRLYLKGQYGIKIPNFDKFNYEAYFEIMDIVRRKMDSGEIKENSFYEISESAWLKASGYDSRNYWFAGFSFGNVSQLDRFFKDGVWEGNGDDKMNNLIKTIQVGDVLIIKSTSTKGAGHKIPFIGIKAIGLVESTWELLPDTNYRFQVNYIPINNKEFEGSRFGQYRKTLHECKDKEVIKWVKEILCNSEHTDDMDNNKYSEYVDLLKASKNLILTGAPGTGKTYMAKQIAYAMGCKEPEFVQFHPSYDYTDFVEGLRPTPDGKFIRKDGVFKSLCKTAYENLVESQKTVEVLSEQRSISDKLEKFLDDAIENGTEFSLKNGNKFSIIEVSDNFISIVSPDNEKTRDISVRISEVRDILEKDVKLNNVCNIREHFCRAHNTQQDSYTFTICNEVRKVQTKGSTFVPKVARKEYVCIIDEINRGELSKIFGELFFSIDPGYRGSNDKVKTQYQNLVDTDDVFAKGFFIPDNVYIIGTMNDIDRSVESMDFAIRRRFAWREIKAFSRVEMWDGKIDSWKQEALEKMTALNTAISGDEIGLGDAYHIGPAYFLALKDLQGDFRKLWEYHLYGVLFEYFRGMRGASDKLNILKNAYFGTSKQTDEQEGTDTNN